MKVQSFGKALSALCLLTSTFALSAQIKLIVANDLGRNGGYEQKTIAATMGRTADEMGPDAVLAIGDTHHYMGVQSTADPLWMTNYELIYSHPELQVPWYPVLGNHEYRGNSQAVLDYSKISRRWQMDERYYTKRFVDDHSGATMLVVFIDTAPLIDKYRNETETYPDVAAQDMERQLAWLEKTLAGAKEDWVVVVGHHPIYAQTSKDESERGDLQTRVEPILNRHKVDLSIGGHVHNFQHIRHNGRDYVVNSSGSQSRKVKSTPETLFCSPEPGFSTISADKKNLEFSMLDKTGKTLYSFTLNR